MQPAHLAQLVPSLAAAADIVEAIDAAALGEHHGGTWRDWNYELVPWGVRFFRRDGQGAVFVSLATVDGLENPSLTSLRVTTLP